MEGQEVGERLAVVQDVDLDGRFFRLDADAQGGLDVDLERLEAADRRRPGLDREVGVDGIGAGPGLVAGGDQRLAAIAERRAAGGGQEREEPEGETGPSRS